MRSIRATPVRKRISRLVDRIGATLETIEERAGRADEATSAPPRLARERVQQSSYSDPTAVVSSERDRLFGGIEDALVAEVVRLQTIVDRLWLFEAPPAAEEYCSCPAWCCPDGCGKVRTDAGSEHPTCRSRQSRMRRRGAAPAA